MAGILYGLKVSEFAHPDDLAAINALKKSAVFDNITGFIEDRTTQIVLQTRTLGNCVRISKNNNERIFRLVRETCEIMEYDKMPEIFTYRGFGIDIEPHGAEKPVIVIPDFVINCFDDSTLRFIIGRAITRFKSDYLKTYIAASGIVMLADKIQFLSDALKVPIANWMRKSELTADRGGLLACQSIRSAMKFLMFKAGMPIEMLDGVDELDYIDTCVSQSKLASFAKKVMTLSNCTGWANDRIIELYNWYAKGEYDELLDEHLD